MKRFLVCLVVLCLAVSFVGCSTDGSGSTGGGTGSSPNGATSGSPAPGGPDLGGGELESFLSEAADVWYRHGNLNGETLNIRQDATWTLTEPSGTTDGVVVFEDGYGIRLNAESESGATIINPVEPIEDGMLEFSAYMYFREDDSIDMNLLYDGNWYLNGDPESDVYEISGGNWRFIDNTNDFAYTVETGYLVWRASEYELEAYRYYNEPPFAVFTIDSGTIISDGKSYERLDGGDHASSGSGERITFITQLYDGENIVEIPYIEYDGEMNPELDAINRLFNQGYQFQYEEFMENKSDMEWIEFKTYPFTTQDYLQIVTTKIVYPNYGTDGYLESVNYDRVTGQWLSIDDALSMFDLTRDDVLAGVGEDFLPDVAGEVIADVEFSGFLIREDVIGYHLELLLTLTVENSEESSWNGFFSYRPDSSDLTRLDNDCLFDPDEMDKMNPPLWYQQ